MNVLEAIYARKSIRKFKDEIVPKEDILKMSPDEINKNWDKIKHIKLT